MQACQSRHNRIPLQQQGILMIVAVWENFSLVAVGQELGRRNSNLVSTKITPAYKGEQSATGLSVCVCVCVSFIVFFGVVATLPPRFECLWYDLILVITASRFLLLLRRFCKQSLL